MIKHLDMTQRIIATATIMLTLIRALEPQRDLEDSMSPKERGSPPKVDLVDMSKTMENITDYLDMFCGVSDACLGYVVRKLLIPIASADDTSSNYTTKDLETIAH